MVAVCHLSTLGRTIYLIAAECQIMHDHSAEVLEETWTMQTGVCTPMK